MANLISTATARAHLRVTLTAEDTLIAIWCGAAEKSAIQFIQRKLYADADALAAAKAAAPTTLSAATTAYDAAIEAADLIENAVEQEAAACQAVMDYEEAQADYARTMNGIVIEDDIRAAMLLTIRHLYDNRGSVVVGTIASELPLGVKHLLQPYRRGMGV